MKTASFLPKLSDSIHLYGAAVMSQALEGDVKRTKMKGTLGVPSLTGETDAYVILAMCSVLSETYSQEDRGT